MTNHTPLTVYKASAGSGKTFTLAIEYISLLIKDPKSYEHILAVTFTNKATEEMKMRIISQLYGIWKQLPDSKGYLEAIKKKTGKLEHDIIKRSGEALSYLIHNYNYFRVQTIDAFFQSVLRNLARELELTANLKVDLNDRQIEEQAVDEMIESLDMDARVLRWISDYIDKNIKDDLSWNVIRSIKDFGRNIFKDFYKKHSKELDELMRNEKFFDEYTKTLRLRRDTIEKNLSNDARTLQSMLQEESFDDPSLYKYGDKGTVLKYVRTIGKQTRFDNSPTPPRVLQFMDDPEKMIAKVDRRDAFISYAQTTLIPKLQSFEKKRLYLWSEYQSAVLTLRHLSQLRLLHAIAETVDEINKRTNRFQLSNTQSLLNSLIKDDDSPFIFEKLGAQLKHIMIDEFQDTSHIQWENFKVLLEDCLAQTGSQSLIVGDVKQSIYRWRSSDWKMLNNIDSEFTEKQMCLQPLTTNYRSQQKIVEFNNAFFEQAVKVTTDELQNDSIDGSEQLMKAYKTDELKQKIHKDKGKGYIRIELLPSSQYRETILEKLLTNVDELLSHGIETKDIAILVRSNSDIRDIATLFMQERPGLRIVSDEAFRLDASLSVNMLVQALRLLSHPEDILTKAKLVKAYNQEVLKNGMSDTQLFVGNDINKYLPQEFFHTEELLMMPLVDLVDRLYTIFQLHFIEHQSAYVCAFYDVLN
ncbi:MAG: UvrD-helicase domain-containing protein, partial [Prevotella sp.]|nr:UvrD-helicase domain-containing protein [Prevotella sp.]